MAKNYPSKVIQFPIEEKRLNMQIITARICGSTPFLYHNLRTKHTSWDKDLFLPQHFCLAYICLAYFKSPLQNVQHTLSICQAW